MRFLLIAGAVLAASLSSALSGLAQGTLKFDSEAHDFKNVGESTLATHEFKFTNIGTAPIVIANVQASCGCTTPDWTKTPVLPGKTGFVKAVYNSAGRPGQFSKTVTVTSNATNASVALAIKGAVLSREEMQKSYTPEQIAASARLTITSAPTLSLGKLENGRSATGRFTFKNTGKKNLTLSGLQSACNCITYKALPEGIAPGETGTITLTYAPDELGERTETVSLFSNDLSAPDIKVTLKATVVKSLAEPSLLREADARVPFK
ncbi:MAG: DUF1573 domain-containing protein [Hymenobacteraceae bacterium]|nr:DUF1573 domain-containing protein [Hymenobacteraceae bacterium]